MTVKEFIHKVFKGKNVRAKSANAESPKDVDIAKDVSARESANAVKDAISQGASIASAKKKSISGIFNNTVIRMHDRLDDSPFVTDSIFGYGVLVAIVILFLIVGVVAAFGNGYAEIQWRSLHPDVAYTSTMVGFVSVMAVTLYQVVIIIGTVYIILVNAVHYLGKTIIGVRDELKPI